MKGDILEKVVEWANRHKVERALLYSIVILMLMMAITITITIAITITITIIITMAP